MRFPVCGVAAILTLLIFTGSAAPTAQQPPIVPPALVQQAAARGNVRVIVEMDTPAIPEGTMSPLGRANQRAAIAGAQARITARLTPGGARNLRRFTTIPFFAVEVTPAALAQLARAPGVRRVTEDRLDRVSLATSVPMIRGDQAWSAGYDGTGWTVAVLDTGVDGTHEFLSGKVVSEACYSANGNCPNGQTTQLGSGAGAPCGYAGSCNHGTHVAGIAAGLGSEFSGVAKGATIIAIQVFSNLPGCSPCSYSSDQILGLERVYDLSNAHQIAAVNMSLGGGRYTSNCDDVESARKAAIDNLRSFRIATVIASGNNGYTDSLAAPACISTAISVGSVGDTTNTVSSFSNSASFLSLLAPGSVITSSVPGNSYASMQGTSMAAPHVAGAWAVLKRRSPSANVSAVLDALRESATVTDTRNGVVTPRIDVVTGLNSSQLIPVFTDADLTGVAVKGLHIVELRARINGVRMARGLAALSWTDVPSGFTSVRAVHLSEMRTALSQAYVAAGLGPPTFTDADLQGLLIKAVHITELRAAVVALEP